MNSALKLLRNEVGTFQNQNAKASEDPKTSARPRTSVAYQKYLDKLKVEFDENYNKRLETNMVLADFEIMTTLGTGSFGQVILCRHLACNKYYAIKVLNKEKIMKDKQLSHSMNEKRVLQAINFPFVVNLEFAFKDNCNLYFALPFVAGGDLFTHLRKSTNFTERDTRFYTSQVCLALEYLHHMGLVYRDLKPENIMVEVTGYIKLTDFGFCKLIKHRTWTLCGTPEYIAPEIIMSKGYGMSIDWWSFGILIYELIAGFTPFYAPDPMRIYEKIGQGKVRFNTYFSSEAKDIIRNLLQVDLTKRYGNLVNGVNDIKKHDWFKVVDWEMIHNHKVIPPYIPKIRGSADISNFDKFKQRSIQIASQNLFAKEFEDF